MDRKNKALSIWEQEALIKANYPLFRTIWNGRNIFWIGDLAASSVSTVFRIKIVYEKGLPRIHVVWPKLQVRPDATSIPHTYSDNSLCLYFPGAHEWDPTMSIADTLIPWTLLWLYYYEVWLVTGKWKGGGEHPC
jgi:hypothetical protein